MSLQILGTTFARLYHFRWVASIVLVLLLDVATYMAFSETSTRQTVKHQDKIMHIFAFFVLFVVGHVSLHFDFFPRLRKRGLLLVVNCLFWLAYGAFIEVGQHFLSYRSASLLDLAADALGIAAGCVFVSIAYLYPRSPKSHG